jgi:hypothetical protein
LAHRQRWGSRARRARVLAKRVRRPRRLTFPRVLRVRRHALAHEEVPRPLQGQVQDQAVVRGARVVLDGLLHRDHLSLVLLGPRQQLPPHLAAPRDLAHAGRIRAALPYGREDDAEERETLAQPTRTDARHFSED